MDASSNQHGNSRPIIISESNATIQTPGLLRFNEIINNTDSCALQDLLRSTKLEADAFLEKFRASPAYRPSPEMTRILNEWYNSEEGKIACSKLGDSVIAAIVNTNSEGHPGHDRRHILYKDPISALRHCHDDEITDYRSIYLLGALLHDVGRMPEPRLYGKPASGVAGVDHQYLGYILLKLLLDEHTSIPQEIKDNLLFSILVHQTGGDRDNFAAQFVQRADREQLVGPEFILRTIGANVGIGRLNFAVPSDTNNSLPFVGHANEVNVVTHIEFYARNLYPNIGSTAEGYVTELKGMSMQFLALAYGDNNLGVLFGPEMGQSATGEKVYKGSKTLLPPAVQDWLKGEDNLKLLNFDRCSISDNELLPAATAALDKLLSAKLAADPAKHKADELSCDSLTYHDNLVRALAQCEPRQLRQWIDAFHYAYLCREFIDSRDELIVGNGLHYFSDSKTIGAKISLLLAELLF